MSGLYDALAGHYRTIAAQRATYLATIDRLILERVGGTAMSVLDVGAADGVRGVALAQAMHAARVVLCEPSGVMARECRTRGANEVWHCAAESMPTDGDPFDVCLCLWNVLGHIEGSEARRTALNAMHRQLTQNGRLFLDVNNRHNASAYGFWKVLSRRIVDRLAWNEHRGDASYTWDVEGTRIKGRGHLFTPAEMDELITTAGFRIIERLGVDYVDGRVTTSPYRGQLFYHLERT